MDIQKLTTLSAGLEQWQARGEANATLLKKTLNQQADTITTLVEGVTALPANPAVGRNINTTA